MPADKQISHKQIEANRRNAQLSTGPRTPEGRAASRLNAYKHGLTGHLDVMTDEQKQARDAFIAEIAGDLQPVGPFERQFAHSIAETQWRINRAAVIENNLFAADACHQELDRLAAAPPEPSGSAPDPQSGVDDLDTALASARTYLAQPESFNLLTVYEMRLYRKFQNDLRQLRALQAARAGEAARQKAADEKQKADTEARRTAALQEAAWLLNLDEEEGKTIQPEGVFRHPNGFVFSNSHIRRGIDYTARLAAAKTLFTRQLNEIAYQAAYADTDFGFPGQQHVETGTTPGGISVPPLAFIHHEMSREKNLGHSDLVTPNLPFKDSASNLATNGAGVSPDFFMPS